MDKLRLINEIYKRPELWNIDHEDYQSRICSPELWKDVAAAMGAGVTVAECKSAWKLLRRTHRQVILKIESQILNDLGKGTYYPTNDYKSKWVYLEPMKFYTDMSPSCRSKPCTKNKKDEYELHDVDPESRADKCTPSVDGWTFSKNTSDNKSSCSTSSRRKLKHQSDSGTGSAGNKISKQNKRFQAVDNVSVCLKEKQHINVDSADGNSGVKSISQSDVARTIPTEGKQMTSSDESSKRYNINVRQGPVNITAYTAINHAACDIQKDSTNLLTAKRRRVVDATLRPIQSSIQSNNELFNTMDEDNIRKTAAVSNDTECSTKHFSTMNNVYIKKEPVDLEVTPLPVANIQNNDSAEKKCNKSDFDDFDCNYLVSFLPHLKAMSPYQKLQFRAEVSNLMLSFYSAPNTPETSTINSFENRKPSCVLKAVLDINDLDCNFLISFLPHMKSMPWLQNLKFRAKMSALMVDICSTSVVAVASDSTT